MNRPDVIALVGVHYTHSRVATGFTDLLINEDPVMERNLKRKREIMPHMILKLKLTNVPKQITIKRYFSL